MALPFFTIGHSNRSSADFIDLLRESRIELVADVRTFRMSRANPQFNEAALAQSLAEAQIGYVAMPALGGRRGRDKTVPDDVNGLWEHRSFHNYADYALSDEFRAGLEDLVALGRERRTAFMCSEAVWWRCHRRLITDWLLARGETVLNIMAPGSVTEATPTPGSVVGPDGTVTYPTKSPTLF
jgi:uncharacterized protein (DUF488 family)